jgi:hypothetical protein
MLPNCPTGGVLTLENAYATLDPEGTVTMVASGSVSGCENLWNRFTMSYIGAK